MILTHVVTPGRFAGPEAEAEAEAESYLRVQARQLEAAGAGSGPGNPRRPARPIPEPGGPKARRLPHGPGHPRQIPVAGRGPGLLFQRGAASGPATPSCCCRCGCPTRPAGRPTVSGGAPNCCATSCFPPISPKSPPRPCWSWSSWRPGGGPGHPAARPGGPPERTLGPHLPVAAEAPEYNSLEILKNRLEAAGVPQVQTQVTPGHPVSVILEAVGAWIFP